MSASCCTRSSMRSSRRASSNRNSSSNCSTAASASPPGSSGNVIPQTCSRSSRVSESPALDKAGDQVGFGEQDIDREPDRETIQQLRKPGADRARMRHPLLFRQRHQIALADRDEDAVDRLPRAVFLQQVEKAEPRRLVRLLVAVLRRVPPGGIQQHRLVGQKPVAIAGPARRPSPAGCRAARPAGI